MDLGWLAGWAGTALGLVMTQMPTKRSVMLASMFCSVAQCVHFGLINHGEAGLVGQLFERSGRQ